MYMMMVISCNSVDSFNSSIGTLITVTSPRTVVVLDVNGNEISSIHLPDVPAAPIVYVDVNNDGLTDMIVPTRGSVLGIMAYRTNNLTAVMIGYVLFLLFVLAIVFFVIIALEKDEVVKEWIQSLYATRRRQLHKRRD